MKVYIVSAGSEDREVKGVFSEESKAKEVVDSYNTNETMMGEQASWEEWEVDGYYMVKEV